MQKSILLALFGITLVLSSFSVSAWTYDYHNYVLGFGNVDAGYTSSSSSTYDKTTTSVDTPWGSQDHVVIKKASTDSFQPNHPTYVVVDNSNHNGYDNYNDGNYWNDRYGYNWNTPTGNGYYHGNYYDPSVNNYHYDYTSYTPLSSSNFRYRQGYNYNDYGNDVYGNSYYYQPTSDWHSQVYNWAY